MYFQRIAKRSISVKISNLLVPEGHQFYNSRFTSSEKSWVVKKPKVMSSKEIRKHFIDYFVSEKNHNYVHSSPIFLNSDPSLLFVNAGMNQFKSLLLDKVSSTHEFYNLRRAVNSQKCIRISGKHNDLNEVGHDFHHHTFFEMLGNWSFGDYFKKEACEMAWELLTKVYGIPEEQLYITYFGGDESLNLPPDKECKNMWLEIGVKEDHIFPFGVKDNFWDMGDTGPCGPCTEIHYDYIGNQSNTLPPSMRLNAGRSDLIEIWNLVFVQYKRDKSGDLESLLKHNVDTGMGLERLTAVLQGTMSNYDTDIFSPLFDAMQKNFNVRPYSGRIGAEDIDGIDTAYRIIADHSRMFTVALSDGLFPDRYDAGHILRKIIRKAAYMANCAMKTRPGVLSTLVPYVVESLDFFPELEKHTQEVIDIVNDEEKLLHQIINRGRKTRNRMAAEANNKVLEGKNVWELYYVYGLDEKIIEDLATEINLKVDWQGYKKINEEKELKPAMETLVEETVIISPEVLKMLQAKNIVPTDDSHKYNYNFTENCYDVPNISSTISAIIQDGSLVHGVEEQENCFLVTDRTNFYSHAGGQVSDIGKIFNEDLTFCVEDVHSIDGFIFHQGKVTKGNISPLSCEVAMSVNKEHRHSCTVNHTATHLLQTALRKIFPYTSQKSSHVDPHQLRFGFSAKTSLSPEQIREVEDFVNKAIQNKLSVVRVQMPFEDVLTLPNVAVIRGENYPDTITAVIIGGDNSTQPFSVEPCCGTHVRNTADIGKFLVMSSKSLGGSMKSLQAVTGKVAEEMLAKGRAFQEEIQNLEEKLRLLESQNVNSHEFLPMLKLVKKKLKECSTNNSIPFNVIQKCESSLKEMKLKLMNFSDLSNQQHQSVEQKGEPARVPSIVEKYMSEKCIPPTVDSYKYNYFLRDGKYYVESISASICAMFQDGTPVEKCESHQQYVIVADKTNFYAEGDGQACDRGLITCEGFVFNVTDVYEHGGHIFHDGWVENGNLHLDQEVLMIPDQDHRKQCSLNHTASHLLHSSLKKLLPYIFPLSNLAGPLNLKMNFQVHGQLSLALLQKVEDLVNNAIQEKMNVSRIEVPAVNLKDLSGIVLVPGVTYMTDSVPVISIGTDRTDSVLTSVEPCYGTHALNTADIEQFLIISSKSSKNMEKTIRAATAKQAETLLENGKYFEKEMLELEDRIATCLQSKEKDCLEMWDLLKEVKIAKNKHETDLPLIMFRRHQDILSEFTVELNKCTQAFVQRGFSQIRSEMINVLEKHVNSRYIIHKISAVGDGRRLVNFALKSIPDRPSIFFAIDGHKTVICSCAVPQNCLTSSFSALLWIQPVATFLEGRTRFHSKNPELSYSIESEHVNKIDKAMQLAKNYIESNL